jgi:hypothetical protein
MGRERTAELELRRQRLLLRSAELRIDLARHARGLKGPLAAVDRLRAEWNWLMRHPWWPVGAVAVFAFFRPRRVLRWGGRLWWGWTSFRRLQNWLSKGRLPPP